MAEDQRAAGSGWALRTICVFGAAAMAAAGVYLFEPAPADLGLYLEQGKYALAGATLIYAALLIALASTAGALRSGNALADYAFSFVAGPIALCALGFLFVALAADALIYRDPVNTWVALLALPAAFCFAAAWLSELAKGREAIVEDSGSGQGRGAAGEFLVVAASVFLALAATVAYINLGYLMFYLLQANLLDGRDVDLSRVGPTAIAVLRDVAVERWQFIVIMGTAGALLIYGFSALSSWTGRASSRGERRKLDLHDQAFIRQCAHDLRAYADAKGYSRDAKRVVRFVVLPSLIVPVLLAFAVGINLHNWVPRPYDPAVLEAAGWHIYERSIGVSAFVMLLAAVFWSVFPNAILARLSRSYSEMSGWASFASNASPISLEAYLTYLLRAGILRREETFDPGKMLHHFNTAWEPLAMYPAVLLTFLAAIAWHHDQSRYHVLTDQYVEVMSYWTLERQRYPYAAVRGVELSCSIDGDRAAASYTMLLPGGFTVDLSDSKSFVDRVADLAHVDALIPASTPRVLGSREGRSTYDPICVEALAADLPEEDAIRLRAVFRTEDWYRARWRERIGARPIKNM